MPDNEIMFYNRLKNHAIYFKSNNKTRFKNEFKKMKNWIIIFLKNIKKILRKLKMIMMINLDKVIFM